MNIQDTKHILKAVSLYKLWNILKLYTSFWLSHIFKKSIIWGQPMTLSIEPTTACNLGCPECPSGLKSFSRKTGNLKKEMNERIISELNRSLVYINFYFQGEPFINKRIYDQIQQATDAGIYTATSTNAHFLTPENCQKIIDSGLKRLIISIDGTTQEVYEQYRKEGSLATVLEGTKNMVAAKKKNGASFPNIIFQFLVVKPNEHQIEEVKKLAKEYNVDELRFKTAQVYDYKNGNNLIPENDTYSRYKKNNKGTYVLKNKMSNHCWRMWSSAVITWDGNVVPCCFDKDATHQMGNLSFVSFQDIWTNNGYQNFRKQILTNRKEIDICKNCSEGSKVWA